MSAEKCLDSDILLQQISVPADWQVVYHQFYDIHPDHPVSVANCPNGDMSELFKSTLWVARHEVSGLMVDVGWAPEAICLVSLWYVLLWPATIPVRGVRSLPVSRIRLLPPSSSGCVRRLIVFCVLSAEVSVVR